jgi:uncharacterized protein YkwD
MPDYACPHCRKSFTAPPSAAAAQVLCPHCRQPVEVPATPASRWFLARNKKKYGPYTWQQLLTLAKRGDVGPDDMLLQEGTKQWLRAGTVRTLFAEREPASEETAVKTAPARQPATAVSTTAPTPKTRPAAAPKKTAHQAIAWLVAACAGAGLCLLLGVGLIAGYFLLERKPVEVKNANRDKAVDATKKTDTDPPKTNDDGPKKEDAGPRNNDKKKPPEDKTPKSLPSDGRAEQFVEQLNRRRKSAGLGQVTLDEELSRGCIAHAKYLAQHLDPAKADGSNVYAEDPKQPGYSDEGVRAAQNAMIAFAEPAIALERWMGRLPGRVALLSPEVQSVGVAFVQNGKGEWIAVLDPVRGRGEPIVIYPAPRQTDVPMSFGFGPEVPEKTVAGFPITVTFPPNSQVTAGSIELRDDKGTAIEGWLWTPEKPVRPNRQRNTVTLIPKALLRAGATYQVKASAQLDGKPWRLAWSFSTQDDADSKGVWAKKALARVNAYRADAGLKPVALDDALSQACLKHGRYLVLNEGNPALDGLKAHDEDLKLPGASVEGREAGLKSDIAIGDFDPLDGLDAWMATLYHRVPILEPNLERIGFACARGRRQGWATLLNVGSGRAGGDRPHPVFYPADNQTGVPLNFPNSGEVPNPIPEDKTGKAGYPITAFFPHKTPLVNALGKLTDAKGNEVPSWFSSKEKPANPNYLKHQGNTVCLIPKEPLPPNATIHVQLQGQLAGKAWEKKWKFTTGDGGLSVAGAQRAVFDRINNYRAQAGLSAVTPDEKLGRGCQLHAEYLVQNTLALANNKTSPNDEDPLLPGYTIEGMRASKQSDVFTNAPTPVIQIDDVMSTFSRRVYLLDPTLQRVGYGCAHDIGRGWRCVLDLNGGRGDARVIVYPAPKQDDVPLVGFDRIDQAKDRPGFPITVTFPRQTLPRNAQAVLTDAAGKNVDIAISSPEKPLREKQQGNTIGVHPLAPLQPGQTYSVTVAAIINGTEWRQEWQFTTTAKKAN